LLSLREGGWRKNLSPYVYLGIILVHTLIISMWKHWYGGWSFGYRMSSDVIPFFILLMAPYVKSRFYIVDGAIFKVFLILSILVQVYGMIFFDGVWHAAFDRGFKDTAWLWSVKDSEIVFNMRRVLVKFNLLDKACSNCMSNIDLKDLNLQKLNEQFK
jgi:hypothetical protein